MTDKVNDKSYTRYYDALYKKYDIEYKSDNFSKGPRTKQGLEHMKKQIEKDRHYKNKEMSNPYWHFEHDPSNAPEMKPLLDMLEEAGIPWSHGHNTPF